MEWRGGMGPPRKMQRRRVLLPRPPRSRALLSQACAWLSHLQVCSQSGMCGTEAPRQCLSAATRGPPPLSLLCTLRRATQAPPLKGGVPRPRESWVTGPGQHGGFMCGGSGRQPQGSGRLTAHVEQRNKEGLPIPAPRPGPPSQSCHRPSIPAPEQAGLAESVFQSLCSSQEKADTPL